MLREAVENHREYALARFYLATALLGRGDRAAREEAATHVRAALRADPAHREAAALAERLGIAAEPSAEPPPPEPPA
jgi:hypothetical protein